MDFTEEQLNGLIVTHAQDGDFKMSNMYQGMLKKLKESKEKGTYPLLAAPYPCRFCGDMVKWVEGQGWKGANDSYVQNHCVDAKGHLPFKQYL
jgi:hypothetical protein